MDRPINEEEDCDYSEEIYYFEDGSTLKKINKLNLFFWDITDLYFVPNDLLKEVLADIKLLQKLFV